MRITCSPCARSQPSTSTVTIRQSPGRPGDGGQRVRVIVVAMRDDACRGRLDRGDRGGFRRQIGGTQPGGAGKAADVQPAQRPDPPQREIAEIGVHRRVGMHRQISRLQCRIGDPFGLSGDADARRGLRVGAAGGPVTSTEQRGSARRCRVCSDRSESSSSNDRSGAQAGVTSEANGCPSATLASVPTRAARSSLRASQAGEGSLMGREALLRLPGDALSTHRSPTSGSPIGRHRLQQRLDLRRKPAAPPPRAAPASCWNATTPAARVAPTVTWRRSMTASRPAR